MSILQSDRVDGLGISRGNNELVLIISDHLGWDDEGAHVSALEAKLSGYIDYVRSGQHHEAIPESAGLPVRINLVCEHVPTDNGELILKTVRGQLEGLGIGFSHETLPAPDRERRCAIVLTDSLRTPAMPGTGFHRCGRG